jgi:hypothetical protein
MHEIDRSFSNSQSDPSLPNSTETPARVPSPLPAPAPVLPQRQILPQRKTLTHVDRRSSSPETNPYAWFAVLAIGSLLAAIYIIIVQSKLLTTAYTRLDLESTIYRSVERHNVAAVSAIEARVAKCEAEWATRGVGLASEVEDRAVKVAEVAANNAASKAREAKELDRILNISLVYQQLATLASD